MSVEDIIPDMKLAGTEELKSELPTGKRTIMFLCMKCGTYIKRDNKTTGDDVMIVNLAITCKCGTVLINVSKESE
jgi:predicted RNA-binding Zn-ribbon protein involved in translation (DUF1610 family)